MLVLRYGLALLLLLAYVGAVPDDISVSDDTPAGGADTIPLNIIPGDDSKKPKNRTNNTSKASDAVSSEPQNLVVLFTTSLLWIGAGGNAL